MSKAVKKARKDQVTYDEMKEKLEVPLKDRKAMPIGRGGRDTVPRKYHLTDEEIADRKAKAEATGGWINPFSGRVGLYWAQVEALYQLGDDQFHSIRKVFDKTKEILSSIPAKGKDGKTVWDTVANREPKKGASQPKDIMGRLLQNFKVLQRLPGGRERNPYGTKLMQFRMCVDMRFVSLEGSEDPTVGKWEIRLHTGFPDEASVKPEYIAPPRAKRSAKSVASTAEQTTEAIAETIEQVVEQDEVVNESESVFATTVEEAIKEMSSEEVTGEVASNEDEAIHSGASLEDIVAATEDDGMVRIPDADNEDFDKA